MPVSIQYFKLGRNEIFPNCSVFLSMVSFCGLLFLVHLHIFILSFCLYCIYGQRRNSFEVNGKPPHLPGRYIAIVMENSEKKKKNRKMPAQLITEVCRSTARWPAYMIYLTFLYFPPSNISKVFTELHRSLCSFGILKFSNSISQIFIDEKIRSLELLFPNCFLASWHEWGKQELIF